MPGLSGYLVQSRPQPPNPIHRIRVKKMLPKEHRKNIHWVSNRGGDAADLHVRLHAVRDVGHVPLEPPSLRA